MKDYYNILGISPEASEKEIRLAYRRLALQHHPDRNPGDGRAEERFKEISEAYGVLINPAKRREYNQWRGGKHEEKSRRDFRYTQNEIFEDLFKDPRASRIFQDLFREFEQAGVRFDQQFFDRLFFGGRGILFGGFFVWGPYGPARVRIFGPRGRGRVQGPEPRQVHPPRFLERLGQKIGRRLRGDARGLPRATASDSAAQGDLHYQVSLPRREVEMGTRVKIALDRGEGRERLSVRIPPGTKPGTRLRLKGKGLLMGGSAGDLYMTVHVN